MGQRGGIKGRQMDEIRVWIEAEGSGHYFFIAFPVCLLILFILLRGRRLRFVVPSLLMSLVIINPLFYRYWDALDLYAYWRILWIVPVISVVAGVVPAITEKIRETMMKSNVVVVGVVLIAFGGTFLYNSIDRVFKVAKCAEKIPTSVVSIAGRLLLFNEHPRVIVQDPIGVYLRQLTGDIDTLYGRDLFGYITWKPTTKAIEIHNEISDADSDLSLVGQYMLDDGYDYLVIDATRRVSDLLLVDTVGDYGIYRAEGRPKHITTRNRLGQILSITCVDETGKPVNGEMGYSTVSYGYNNYGDVVREFHTDVAGKGVANEKGVAGYEREVDKHGFLVMEKQLGPDGKPTKADRLYAEVRWEYRGRNMTRFSYYDEDGCLVNNVDGFAVCDRTYDNKGNIIQERYLDQSGSPVMAYGYHEVRRIYDKDNRITSERYYDASGNPMNLPEGYAEIHYRYDAEGNILQTDYFDLEGIAVSFSKE